MQYVLITGASGGVARALASKLQAQGQAIALLGRDLTRLSELEAAWKGAAELSQEAGAEAALDAVTQALGAPPAGIVHCVGSTLIAPIQRTNEAQYRAVMAANIDSAFFLARAYVQQLTKARAGGSLVLFSSVVAGTGVANHAAIAAAKGAIESLTRSLAADWSGLGIRVNCIAPGLMRTPMTERMVANEASARQIAAQYPLGRHGEAADAAELAAFLVSPASAWITGQVIGLDGGFSAVRPLVRS